MFNITQADAERKNRRVQAYAAGAAGVSSPADTPSHELDRTFTWLSRERSTVEVERRATTLHKWPAELAKGRANGCDTQLQGGLTAFRPPPFKPSG